MRSPYTVTDLSQLRALVVEANPGMRTQMRGLLAMAGIERIEFAVSAGSAVRKLKGGRFDLIFSEYHLGEGQDGQHLLEDLRHHQVIPLSTLFFMVTGERQYERVVSTVELAPNDYILKPFAADTLHERILRALERRDAFLPAYQLIELGNTHDAITYCLEAEEHYAQWSIDFMRLRAELLLIEGRAEEAQTLYQWIIDIRAIPWAKLGLAKALFSQKRYGEAEELLQDLVRENELFLDAYDWLSRTRREAGHLEAARTVLASASALSPHRVDRLRRLGELALDTGDTETATRVLSEVVRKGKYSDFRDPEDHVRLVQAHLGSGDTQQAEAAIRDLERSMHGLHKTRLCAALSSALLHTSTGDTEKAQAALRQAASETAARPDLSVGLKRELARTCFAHQEAAHGTEIALDIMRNAPDERSVQLTKAMLKEAGHGHLGDELAERMKKEVQALIEEGARKAKADDLDGAVELMMSAVHKMPGNPHVLFNAALAILKHMERHGWNDRFAEEARRLVAHIRQQDPAHPRLPALITLFHTLLKKYGIQP